ncbi:MAG: acetate--CoA ligase family protein, partial [Pseudomonadota bacterium]
IEALRIARDAGKSTVLMKVGRTEAGGAAAASHTASLAGDDAVFDAALRDAGAIRARRTDAFIDALYGLARHGPLRGRKLGIATISGGAGVLMADDAVDAGFELTPMPAAAQARLSLACPFGSPVNPVDITAQAINDMGLVGLHLREMFEQGGYDAVGGFFLNWARNPALGPRMAQALAEGRTGHEDRLLALSGAFPRDVAGPYEAAGALIYEDPTALIHALDALAHAGEAPDRALPALPEADLSPLGRSDEAGAKALLRDAGLPFPDERAVPSPAAAGAAAAELGGTLALKILSPDLAHKSEVGGVRLGLAPAEVPAAAEAMDAAVAAAAPAARRSGFLVTPMLTGVAELIMGARVDPVFGPVVLVGAGGVFAEVMRDTVLRLAPVDEATAARMLGELRAFPLLDGARGRPRADLGALAQALAALSRVVATRRRTLSSVELNPVLALEQGCVALDAALTAIEAPEETAP